MNALIGNGAPVSAKVGFWAILLALIIAIPLGTTAASTTSVNGVNNFESYLNNAGNNSLASIFQKAADTYGVSVSLLTAMAKQESNFQTNATSKSGAMGIMQLMPSTAS